MKSLAMKIGFFGDGRWGVLALNRLAADEQFAIVFVVARHSRPDPILAERAAQLSVPFFAHHDVNAPEFVTRIHEFGADIIVSMSFDQILKLPLLEATPYGVINCHAGALPFYRGRNPLNWALINGEVEFGVTVHYADAGIDTGDIVLQRMVPIAPADDYGTVLPRAEEACADVLHEALVAIAAGTAGRDRQIERHPVGFYVGRRRDGDEWLDWSWPSARVVNFVRALAPPGPGARSSGDRGVLAVLAAQCIDNAPCYLATAGEVVGRTCGGVVVKTGDSTVLVTKIAPIDGSGRVQQPGESRLRIGTRLGAATSDELRRLWQRIANLEGRLEKLESGRGVAVE